MKDQIRDTALNLVDQRKGAAVGELGSLASALRRVGDELGDSGGFAGTAVASIANRVESLTRSLEQKDIRGVMGDVEQFARGNPVAFVGGAVALGFIASRFLKSDPSAVPEPEPAVGLTSETELPATQTAPPSRLDGIADSPLIAGLAALAVGAIFGALIPETTREHQLFGETKETLKERATTAARQKVSHTISAVTGANG